jgi:hypothetical protein
MLNHMQKLLLLPFLLLAACNSEIYTRNGVTDGDSFYLAPRAFQDDDPVLQSWVAYSLMKSTCQLEVGGKIPARVSDYGCELTARRHLLDTWDEQRLQHAAASDPYLDTLLAVRNAGFLDAYTVHYFSRKHWQVPVEVRLDEFHEWHRKYLPGHKPETRLIGSWGYRQR